jgi:hypothetical protein
MANKTLPIINTAWVHARLCKLQKGCTRLADASDKDYLLLDHGQWFSPETSGSSTTKNVLWFLLGTVVSSTNTTNCHNIPGIFLKVWLNIINQIKPDRKMRLSG